MLGGVLLDARTPGSLTVLATDLELAIRSTLPASGEGGWVRVVDAGLLTKLVGRLPGEQLALASPDTNAAITCGGARFTLTSMDADEFPEMPTGQALATVRLEAHALSGALALVIIPAGDSDKRPVLSGVLFKVEPRSLALAPTDISRRATEMIPLDESHPAIGQRASSIGPGALRRRSGPGARRRVPDIGGEAQARRADRHAADGRLHPLCVAALSATSRRTDRCSSPTRRTRLRSPGPLCSTRLLGLAYLPAVGRRL